jgi:hypothetical protein
MLHRSKPAPIAPMTRREILQLVGNVVQLARRNFPKVGDPLVKVLNLRLPRLLVGKHDMRLPCERPPFVLEQEGDRLERLGGKLDADEQEFKFYRILDGG